jgi:hypothetical protein
MRGLILVYLLILIIHVREHASTHECGHDYETQIKFKGSRVSLRSFVLVSKPCMRVVRHTSRITMCVSEKTFAYYNKVACRVTSQVSKGLKTSNVFYNLFLKILTISFCQKHYSYHQLKIFRYDQERRLRYLTSIECWGTKFP